MSSEGDKIRDAIDERSGYLCAKNLVEASKVHDGPEPVTVSSEMTGLFNNYIFNLMTF